MYPATYNVKLKRGSSFYRKITCKNKVSGVLTNFTSYTAKMDIRERVGGDLLTSLTTENGSLVLGGANGTIEIKISPAQTKTLTPDKCKYDLDLISSSGDVFTYIEGDIDVSPKITAE